MDTEFNLFLRALKTKLQALSADNRPFSLILMIGQSAQGKTSLLEQSGLQMLSGDFGPHLKAAYQTNGACIELNEHWLSQSQNLLESSIAAINTLHRALHITAIVQVIDIHKLVIHHQQQHDSALGQSANLLKRFLRALGSHIPVGLIFTRMDTLEGFQPFFQTEHPSELQKPLGFGLQDVNSAKILAEQFQTNFDTLCNQLAHQTLDKIHPVRSGEVRVRIREFPLQMAGLKKPIMALLYRLAQQKIYPEYFYFCSARQNAADETTDVLKDKLQHEFALSQINNLPMQNHQQSDIPYFTAGALDSLIENTRKISPNIPRPYRQAIAATLIAATGFCTFISYQAWQTRSTLDETSKELIAYENQAQNPFDNSRIMHLHKAEILLAHLPAIGKYHPAVHRLQNELHKQNQLSLQDDFAPIFLAPIEHAMLSTDTSVAERYQALKAYLVLFDKNHHDPELIKAWYRKHWLSKLAKAQQQKQARLLEEATRRPLSKAFFNAQYVQDLRNYLGALPSGYYYYQLVKQQFPQKNTPLDAKGFKSKIEFIPYFATKDGFNDIQTKLMFIAQNLLQEDWVVKREKEPNLAALLLDAYCYDYNTWWKGFIKQTRLKPGQEEHPDNAAPIAALDNIINLIQAHTAPDPSNPNSVFNQKIAGEFTAINLLSKTAVMELSHDIAELEKFGQTLTLVKDNGKTAFELARARFEGQTTIDPLSKVYLKVKQLPEPVAGWTKNLADTVWQQILQETRNYLNHLWKTEVFAEYESQIAGRYPFVPESSRDIHLVSFNHFFSPKGTLAQFMDSYLKPFIDTNSAQWRTKDQDGYTLPLSNAMVDELIRANVIRTMFFPKDRGEAHIDFSLQKLELDPIVSTFRLRLGQERLLDHQNSDSYTLFTWPNLGASIELDALDGQKFKLAEKGPWAFFKLLQKVNVLTDNDDSASLQILFEINGNSGRYLLKAQNDINPFSPGILTGFKLTETLA